MVSDSKATLPESSTTTICTRAVTRGPTKDHFTAQMPRSEVVMVGSTAPWAGPCSPCPRGRGDVLRRVGASRRRFYRGPTYALECVQGLFLGRVCLRSPHRPCLVRRQAAVGGDPVMLLAGMV